MVHQKLRGQDSNLRPPGYEPDELPLLYPASVFTITVVYYRGAGASRICLANFIRLARKKSPGAKPGQWTSTIVKYVSLFSHWKVISSIRQHSSPMSFFKRSSISGVMRVVSLGKSIR